MRSLLFLFLISLAYGSAKGCQLVWSDSVVALSSSYQNNTGRSPFSGLQATGASNVQPPNQSSPCAWSPSLPSNPFGEYVHVRWRTPQPVQVVLIYESLNAGSIYRVRLYDTEGKEHEVYRKSFDALSSSDRSFLQVTLEEPTPYKVASVRIDLATHKVSGWNHIDAVGIASCKVFDWPFPHGPQIFDQKPVSTIFAQKDDRNYYSGTYDASSRHLYYTAKNQGSNQKGELNYRILNPQGRWSAARQISMTDTSPTHPVVWSATRQGAEVLINDTTSSGYFRWMGLDSSLNLWVTVDSLSLPVNNRSNYFDLFLSPSRHLMIISAELEDSYGGRDLYLLVRQKNGRWSNPRHLGPKINTCHADFSPYLAADETTLYFASQGHPGLGGADIYVSKRLDGSWKRWSKPINLGTKVNDSGWNAFPCFIGPDKVSFTTQNEKGLFRLAVAPLANRLRPEPSRRFHFRLLRSGKPCSLRATIVYRSPLTIGRRELNGESAFNLLLPHYVDRFRVVLQTDTGKRIIPIEVTKAAPLDTQIYLELRKKLNRFPSDKLLFAGGTAELLPAGYEVLDSLQRYLTVNPEKRIILQGHTDYDGESYENIKLSQNRVQFIKSWLTRHRISASRIELEALGETQPLYRGQNARKRAQNRRVEILIKDY